MSLTISERQPSLRLWRSCGHRLWFTRKVYFCLLFPESLTRLAITNWGNSYNRWQLLLSKCFELYSLEYIFRDSSLKKYVCFEFFRVTNWIVTNPYEFLLITSSKVFLHALSTSISYSKTWNIYLSQIIWSRCSLGFYKASTSEYHCFTVYLEAS